MLRFLKTLLNDLAQVDKEFAAIQSAARLVRHPWQSFKKFRAQEKAYFANVKKNPAVVNPPHPNSTGTHNGLSKFSALG